MMKFLKRRIQPEIIPDQNRIEDMTEASFDIMAAKKRIIRQASLTVLTLVLTVVILFAMTSAWYSNVVQTSGLTFEAESWGFDGKIAVGDEAILAAPGDEGIIDLTVENESDSVSALSVNVNKDQMAEEMQQRLFFYVDTQMNRGGEASTTVEAAAEISETSNVMETMDRVYINKFEGYTYYVFDQSALTLTEEYSNAPVIKWEWVYDVLGYYVMGQPDVVTAADGDEVQKIKVDEYLRPIQYDFDEATTQINRDENNNITVKLTTVDGKQTPEAFLEELSKTDGYPGTIDAENDVAFGNYYKVDVDEETGYGVYAYLCSYSEIQEAIKYDTGLGELAARKAASDTTLTADDLAELQHTAKLSLSAQKEDDTVVTVSTVSGLQEAIVANMASVIQLNGDLALGADTTLLIPENTRIMLDLNGKTITNQAGTAIMAQPGSSLTLTGGSLIQEDQSSETNPATTYGIRTAGAEVYMNKMNIQDFQYSVYVGDNAEGNELDSRVYVKDSTIDGEICAVFISGNGLLTEQKSSLVIEKSTLTSPNIVVSGNGDATGNGRWGTDIQILDSTLTGTKADENSLYGTGIYQPQMKSTLIVKNSKVEGGNGIVLKGGSAKILDKSTIIANSPYKEPQEEKSGFTETGDSIYIETTYGYEIQLYISGDTTMEHEDGCKSVRVFKEDAENVYVEYGEETAGDSDEGTTQTE